MITYLQICWPLNCGSAYLRICWLTDLLICQFSYLLTFWSANFRICWPSDLSIVWSVDLLICLKSASSQYSSAPQELANLPTQMLIWPAIASWSAIPHNVFSYTTFPPSCVTQAGDTDYWVNPNYITRKVHIILIPPTGSFFRTKMYSFRLFCYLFTVGQIYFACPLQSRLMSLSVWQIRILPDPD